MSRLSLAVVSAALAVLALAGSSSNCAFAQKTEEPRDLYGDPLPAGAVLRLGTIRLRHPESVLSVAFSPNGQTLASVGAMDPQIRLWDARTGRLVRTFLGPIREKPRAAVFAPNGARLAVACERGGVQLWDISSGLEVLEVSQEHDHEGIETLAFTPDGRSFVTASSEGALRLWQADNSGRQRLLLQLGPQDRGQHALACSPDGKLLAFGVRRNIRVYDLESGAESRRLDNAHGDTIRSLAFAPDSRTLVSAGDSEYHDVPGKPDSVGCNPRLRIWDVANGKLIREFTDASEKGSCAAALSRDGHTLALRESNSIKICDVSSAQVLRTIPRFWLPTPASNRTIHERWAVVGSPVAISPDATTVATTTTPLYTIKVWDAATGANKLPFPDSHSQRVEGVACSPDGSRIATAGGQDGTIRLWDAVSSKILRTFVLGSAYPCEAHCVAFSPDGNAVVGAGSGFKNGQNTGIVRIWDVESGDIRLELLPGTDVARVAFSQDGSRLAIAATNFRESLIDGSANKKMPREPTLLIVDAKTGVEHPQIELEDYPRCLAFSPNAEMISVVGKAGVISTWKLATGKLVQRSAVGRDMMSAAITDDGTLAAVSRFRTDEATLWDLRRAKRIGQIALENEGNPWSALAISRDKLLLASASNGGEDKTPEKYSIRIWSLRSGRMLQRFSRPLCNRILSMEFTPDGHRLISGMSDGTCLVWAVSKM